MSQRKHRWAEAQQYKAEADMEAAGMTPRPVEMPGGDISFTLEYDPARAQVLPCLDCGHELMRAIYDFPEIRTECAACGKVQMTFAVKTPGDPSHGNSE